MKLNEKIEQLSRELGKREGAQVYNSFSYVGMEERRLSPPSLLHCGQRTENLIHRAKYSVAMNKHGAY